jgi:predicted metal-dependent phosphoesterase TrpH
MQFDLHLHSALSPDSFSAVRDIAAAARQRGLAGIALTDHGTTASEEAVAVVQEQGLWCIRGNEVQTEIGDILGLFLTGPVRNRTAERVIDEIHDQGGIAVLAHPFKYRKEYPLHIVRKLDAVEVANARWRDLQAARQEDKVRVLLRGVRGRTAGSDAHFPFEVGRTCWVTAPVTGPGELKQLICSGDGQATMRTSSRWLDEASQCAKFLKQPSPRQFARILYHGARRLAGVPRTGLP